MFQFVNSSKWRSIILFSLGFLLYSYSISFEYAQDDAIVISDNMFTEKGISGIPDILTHDTFYGFFKEQGKDKLVQGGRYRPATQITFAKEQSFFGGNPHISHAFNALFYGLLCLVLYKVLAMLFMGVFSENSLERYNEGAAWIIGLIFAAHPIHTEVVANIKGRDEIFVALFGLLCMYFLWKRNKTKWHYIAAYISILIAYFSKENAMIFVIVIPLTVWFFAGEREDKKALWLSMIPVGIIAMFYLFVRSQILGPGISAATTELMNNPFLKYNGSSMVPFSVGEKWATITYNLGIYLKLMVIPFPLTSDYYPYHISIKSWSNIWVILSALIHIALVGFGIWGTVKKKPIGWAIAWYFGFLFLVSNVPFNIGTNISERFLFLPSIGFITGIVLVVYHFLGKRSATCKTLIFPLLIILILFSTYTVIRSYVWKDDFTLLTTDVHQSPNSAKALNGAAGALSTKAVTEKDPEKQKELWELSNTYTQRALKLYPFYSNAYLIQGNNYQYLKQYDDAIASYNQLLRLSPEHSNGMQNLQIAYRDAGRYYGEKLGDLTKSMGYLNEAYKMDNTDYETIRLLGVSNGIAGNVTEAISYFQKGIEVRPNDAFAWYNLSNAYYNSGDEENGLKYRQKALQIDPKLQEKLQK